MIGARHAAGSTISNGGDSSPLNWVIVGRRPWNPSSGYAFVPEKRRFYVDCIVDNHNRSAKRKKFETGWNVSSATKNACGD